jgi:hypothetical protein
MHWPFVTAVRFENEDGGVLRLDYAVAAVDVIAARKELQRSFLILKLAATQSKTSRRLARCKRGCSSCLRAA